MSSPLTLKTMIIIPYDSYRYFEENKIPLSKIKSDIMAGVNDYVKEFNIVYMHVDNRNRGGYGADGKFAADPQGLYIYFSDLPTSTYELTIKLDKLTSVLAYFNPEVNLVIWVTTFPINGLCYMGYGGGSRPTLSSFILNPSLWVNQQNYVTQNPDGKFTLHKDGRLIQFYATHENGHTFSLTDYGVSPDRHSTSLCYMNAAGAQLGYGFCDKCKAAIIQKKEEIFGNNESGLIDSGLKQLTQI